MMVWPGVRVCGDSDQIGTSRLRPACSKHEGLRASAYFAFALDPLDWGRRPGMVTAPPVASASHFQNVRGSAAGVRPQRGTAKGRRGSENLLTWRPLLAICLVLMPTVCCNTSARRSRRKTCTCPAPTSSIASSSPAIATSGCSTTCNGCSSPAGWPAPATCRSSRSTRASSTPAAPASPRTPPTSIPRTSSSSRSRAAATPSPAPSASWARWPASTPTRSRSWSSSTTTSC